MHHHLLLLRRLVQLNLLLCKMQLAHQLKPVIIDVLTMHDIIILVKMHQPLLCSICSLFHLNATNKLFNSRLFFLNLTVITNLASYILYYILHLCFTVCSLFYINELYMLIYIYNIIWSFCHIIYYKNIKFMHFLQY